MALLEAAHLTKTYGSEEVTFHALRDVSITVDPGEFVAIMGPSGSGKSTLLHLLGLLDRPSSGSYTFAGQDILSLSDAERARLRNTRIGFVFQTFHLLRRTSVLDNVMLPLQYSSLPRAEWQQYAAQALQQVGMTHRLRHVPAQLSGGEKQRVAIARAIVNNPTVILADEPTGNLDSASGEQVMKLLASLNRSEHTVVLVTHELSFAQYAQRRIQLRDGQIV